MCGCCVFYCVPHVHARTCTSKYRSLMQICEVQTYYIVMPNIYIYKVQFVNYYDFTDISQLSVSDMQIT